MSFLKRHPLRTRFSVAQACRSAFPFGDAPCTNARPFASTQLERFANKRLTATQKETQSRLLALLQGAKDEVLEGDAEHEEGAKEREAPSSFQFAYALLLVPVAGLCKHISETDKYKDIPGVSAPPAPHSDRSH